MIIEIIEVDSPNQKYPIFLSTHDIVMMNSNTGEVRFQRGHYSGSFKVTTEKFGEILDHWKVRD